MSGGHLFECDVEFLLHRHFSAISGKVANRQTEEWKHTAREKEREREREREKTTTAFKRL